MELWGRLHGGSDMAPMQDEEEGATMSAVEYVGNINPTSAHAGRSECVVCVDVLMMQCRWPRHVSFCWTLYSRMVGRHLAARDPDQFTLSELLRAPLDVQVLQLMRRTNILPFAKLREYVSATVSDHELVQALQRVAHVLQGNWVLKRCVCLCLVRNGKSSPIMKCATECG